MRRRPEIGSDNLLGNAVANDHLRRAAWLLNHGANADGPHAYSKRPLREEAERPGLSLRYAT